MFKDMMSAVYRDVVHHIFHLNIERFNHQELERRRQEELASLQLGSGAPEEPTESHALQQQQRAGDKVGRNDACPCGSGKKYKKCCGAA